MTNTTFETKVLAQLDDIDGRLEDIELSIAGVDGDPNNRGIHGALTVVTEKVDAIKKHQREDVDAINERQREAADDIDDVKDEQTKQKALLLGAAYGAGFAGATSVASLLKLSGAF